MAGHHDVIGDAMAAVLRIMAADPAELMELLRQEREVLDDAATRNARRNRRELAANLGGRFGFWIEGINVARAALHPHQDAIDIAPARRAGSVRDGIRMRLPLE